MEDINAKRNARMKRILENSEKRLLKITGRDNIYESKDLSSLTYSAATDIQKETSHPNINDEMSGIDSISKWTKTSSSLLLTNRINYILLAIIVNILLILQLDHLFGKSHFASFDERKRKEIEIKQKELMARGLPKSKPLKGVKQIIVVASGKGGVGKSTIAVNLSTALKTLESQKSVGLLDADVFGPSIPLMMNIQQSPAINDANFIEPLINYGVKCMSMGFLIDDKSPVIWRGLMVMNAIDKLLHQVAWEPLDYLIIDTPPGTGDTHLSIIQNLPIAGALLITTPQKAALEVTRRGANMFKRLNIPIIGIVENMSNVICPKCIQILQTIPLSENIANSCDTGKPIVLSAPKSIQADAYKYLAKHVILYLAKQLF
ncbi:Iron-sulfur protein NUBPL [Eufriesea mexicana]|uniref:Iron-sulfur protein NUBPL n=1 Tax=Eufriesea mexicana TaxID=516756 RepID=A0A310SND5_9HYME|nr:Iron-sulfur protein NUBPL [Eufriesea mexicana]